MNKIVTYVNHNIRIIIIITYIIMYFYITLFNSLGKE